MVWCPGGRVDFYHIIYIILNPLVIMPIFIHISTKGFVTFFLFPFLFPLVPSTSYFYVLFPVQFPSAGVHLLPLLPVSCPISFWWGPPLTFTSCFLHCFLMGQVHLLPLLPVSCLVSSWSGPILTFPSCFLSCFFLGQVHLLPLLPVSCPVSSCSGPHPTFTSCFLSCFFLGPVHLLPLLPVFCPVSFWSGLPLTFTSCFLSCLLLVGSTSYLYFLFPVLFPPGLVLFFCQLPVCLLQLEGLPSNNIKI